MNIHETTFVKELADMARLAAQRNEGAIDPKGFRQRLLAWGKGCGDLLVSRGILMKPTYRKGVISLRILRAADVAQAAPAEQATPVPKPEVELAA